MGSVTDFKIQDFEFASRSHRPSPPSEDRRRSARAVESFEQEWAEQVRRAHEQEKRELEKLREFRLQIQQKNLGERDQVTVELVGRGGEGRADGEEEEEDEDVARALGREGGRG